MHVLRFLQMRMKVPFDCRQHSFYICSYVDSRLSTDSC